MHYFTFLCIAAAMLAQEPIPGVALSPPVAASSYVLGPGDQLSFAVANLSEEFGDRTYRIDLQGEINLPLAGRMHAAGLTVERFERQVQERLAGQVKDPQVVVTVAEFNSQPVSVLGAVNNAGVKQVAGSKSLFEMLSLAGGLRSDAGSTIWVTRKLSQGVLPLPDAKTDTTGRFSVGSVSVKSVLNATDPAQNIVVQPGDVISVSKADVIYAVGSVTKPGGFPLNQDATLSALQVVSLAGGLTKTAATDKARILRPVVGSSDRIEIAVNLKRIMAGKAPDLALQPNDILFVPNNNAKSASYKALDALIVAATYGRIY